MSEPAFFTPLRGYSAGEIALLTGSELREARLAERRVTGVASLATGGDGMLVFAEGRRNFSLLNGLKAAALLCTPELAAGAPAGIAVLVSPRPQRAFAIVARMLYPSAARPGALTGESGLSPQALIDPAATVEPGAIVEAGAVVCAGASIGSGTVLAPHVVVGPSCQIGRDGYIGPGVTIQAALLGNRVYIHPGARIGQDGFGYTAGSHGPEKVPQIGRVIVQDDVEIGANSTIDRGAMSDTVIGEGAKIDNLVQIAHNVRIGRGCIVAAQCGISGSVTIGDFAMLGGSVGIADHLSVGAGAQLAAGSGVMEDVPAGARWGGSPAVPIRDWLREVAVSRKLGRSPGRKGG